MGSQRVTTEQLALSLSVRENVNSQLTGKVPYAGKDWEQKERRALEDEMTGWRHQWSGHELGHTSGDGEGQGVLACCSPWDHKESDKPGHLNHDNSKRYIRSAFVWPPKCYKGGKYGPNRGYIRGTWSGLGGWGFPEQIIFVSSQSGESSVLQEEGRASARALWQKAWAVPETKRRRLSEEWNVGLEKWAWQGRPQGSLSKELFWTCISNLLWET